MFVGGCFATFVLLDGVSSCVSWAICGLSVVSDILKY